ncbi:hypothetical protein [Mycobacterium sp. TY815]|nr:hypothetical protein [Mycobacterium sp. TY815]MDP7706791.1 hypothetical protein [Mycobacterium sp. TY815]
MTITFGDAALWLLFAGTALLAIGFILGELQAHHHDDHKKGHR